MRVFVTGATGFIGFAIVRELLDAGHQVTGLARSQASAARLLQAGAQVRIGGVEDLDLLRSAAREADGAIHTAFYHKVSHIPLALRLRVLLGGAPGGIVRRFLTTAVTTDRRAVETIGQVFAGSGRPLVATFATLAMQPGRLAAEEDALDPAFVGAPRAQTEETMQALASRRVRTTIIRLPPIVHGAGDRGFALRLVETARKKKLSAYIGDGTNRWPSVHRLDAARLYRLALESGPAGGTCHGVAEEGIPFREIAAVIGRRLHLPVAGIPPAQAAGHFGFLAPFIPRDNPTSSRQTRQRLGWEPTQPGLLADLEQADYFTS